ncbi:MAG: CDP-alcohol phosphatidyltransferase family protein, partial [Bdellovibrionota bacterium]
SRMSLPAIIVREGNSGDQRIVALSVIERLVVAAHRAGCSRITVVSKEPLPGFHRTQALGVSFDVVPSLPNVQGPFLLASTGVFVGAADVKRLLNSRGRLVQKRGGPLPIGVTNAFRETIEKSLENSPAVVAEGVAGLATDRKDAQLLAKNYWASLTSSADGIVDKYFNRPVGRYLSKVLVHTPVTPNQVTILAMIVGLAAAWAFSQGTPQGALWGALIFQLSAIIDCVDGDIARAVFKETKIGKWLDLAADQVVHISLFAAIAVGVQRAGLAAPVEILGTSVVLGALASFAVVLRGLLLPEDKKDPRLSRLIDSAATRDFSVVILAFVLAGRLDWFLWLAAVGIHGFWVLALWIQLRGRPAPKAGPPVVAGP